MKYVVLTSADLEEMDAGLGRWLKTHIMNQLVRLYPKQGKALMAKRDKQLQALKDAAKRKIAEAQTRAEKKKVREARDKALDKIKDKYLEKAENIVFFGDERGAKSGVSNWRTAQLLKDYGNEEEMKKYRKGRNGPDKSSERELELEKEFVEDDVRYDMRIGRKGRVPKEHREAVQKEVDRRIKERQLPNTKPSTKEDIDKFLKDAKEAKERAKEEAKKREKTNPTIGVGDRSISWDDLKS